MTGNAEEIYKDGYREEHQLKNAKHYSRHEQKQLIQGDENSVSWN